MLLEYLKENPILTAVLAASLAVIFIVIVAMVVKNAKEKKRTPPTRLPRTRTNDTNALSSASEEKEACVRPAYEARPKLSERNRLFPSGDVRGRVCPRRATSETSAEAQTSETSAEAEAEERPEPIESDDKSESGEKRPCG
ncbi:MAG: hypothetical protein ACLS4Z_03755 [Christensenellaceae bacterium]